MAEAIKVAVRVRPFNQREKDLKSELVVSMQGPNTTVMSDGKPKTFTYDFSYWSHTDESDPAYANQEKVMKDIGVVILNNALNGYNGCLFAYGQTGSGKSYSVMGYGDAPGIIPRSVDKIFEMKKNEEGDANKELRVWISYIEIYNEHIRDLLHAGNEPTELKVQDHPKLGVYIPDLTEVPCTAPGDVTKLMDFGTKKRVVAATQMNATSSRSHAVFTVKVQFLEGAKPEPDKKDERKCLNAKINLVDLAGSERSSKTGAEGATLKEGCAINQSLSALGMVIKELSESMAKKGGKGGVVPFRASKLTFLLKDSLAGNSKTYMVAALSPASDNREETISTLRFASSVKSIKTVAVQNKDKKDELIEQLQEEIKRMKEQGMIAGEGEGGGGGGGISVEEKEKMVAEMKQSFEDQVKQSKEMEETRIQEALDDGCLSQDEINQAFGVDAQTPYLLNMADDPMLAGCLLYMVKEGAPTTIGSAKENTIKLQGIGISEELCTIENQGNTDLTISKLGEKGRCVVNGKLLQEGQSVQLDHNDKIFLGRAYALKLTLPAKASVSADNSLSLEGLEDEAHALDDSPSWASIQMFLDHILGRMEKDCAKKLFEEVKEACKLSDEANDITEECRGDEQLRFEVDLTNSLPYAVVIRVLQHPEDPSDNPSTLYLWPVGGFRERLQRMRDAHAEISRKGSADVDQILDPWHESKHDEVANRLNELERANEDLRNENTELKNAQMAKLQKAMMAWMQGSAEKQKGICFHAWAAHAKAMNANKKPARRSISLLSRKGSGTSEGGTTPSRRRASNAATGADSKAATPEKSKEKATTPDKSKEKATTPDKSKEKATDPAKTTAPPKTTDSESAPPKTRTAEPTPTAPVKEDTPANENPVSAYYPLPDEWNSSEEKEIKKPSIKVPGKVKMPKAATSIPPSPQIESSDQETRQALNKSKNLTKMLDKVGDLCDCDPYRKPPDAIAYGKTVIPVIDQAENDMLRVQLDDALQLADDLKNRLLSQADELSRLRDDPNSVVTLKDRNNYFESKPCVQLYRSMTPRMPSPTSPRMSTRTPRQMSGAVTLPLSRARSQTLLSARSQTDLGYVSQTDSVYVTTMSPPAPVQTNLTFAPPMSLPLQSVVVGLQAGSWQTSRNLFSSRVHRGTI